MLSELEKETVDVASPAENEEMLTYCLKWIQIMTELRIASMVNFNPFDDKAAQEKVAVIERMDQKIAEHLLKMKHPAGIFSHWKDKNWSLSKNLAAFLFIETSK